MPKYVSRATGEIAYPDQIRSGEVTDAMQVAQYPEQPAPAPQQRYSPTVPSWTSEGYSPEKISRTSEEEIRINPFGNWLIGANILLMLAIIAGLTGGVILSGIAEVTGFGAFIFVVGVGLSSALAMAPIYLGIHIGSVLWESKEELRKLNAARS